MIRWEVGSGILDSCTQDTAPAPAMRYQEYRCDSLHHQISYTSDKQHNFRRARSCDNLLDGEWRGTRYSHKRKEQAWEFHYGHHIGSTIDKERSTYHDN